MSKVRPDQFPHYSSVLVISFRLDSKKIPLEYQLKCAFNPQNEISILQNMLKSIESPLNNNME